MSATPTSTSTPRTDATAEILTEVRQRFDFHDFVDGAFARTLERELSVAIDALDMMRDEFQRIIACPGCNAEIEDLANRAQLKLLQHVPVIVQRDRAESEVARLRYALLRIVENQDTKVTPDRWIIVTAEDALNPPKIVQPAT